MRKFSVRVMGVVLACLMGLASCTPITQIMPSHSKQTEAPGKGASANAIENRKEIAKDLDRLVEVCLKNTEKVNSAGYPLDESFYLWMYHRYGEGIFRKLSASLAQGSDKTVFARLTGNTIHSLWIYYCMEIGIHPETLDNVYIKGSQNSTDIVMNFAGDVNFDDTWENVKFAERNYLNVADCFTNGLLEQMQDADLMMINNECTYGTRGTPLAGKAYTFRGHPKRAKNLRSLGVDLVSLANNHVYDYGAKGLLTTMKTLRDNGIPYVGAGKDLNEASKALYFVINGKVIAITAATQVERTYRYTKEATKNSPGVLKCQYPEKYLRIIEEAKKRADYVIAFVHWGTEGKVFYEKDQVDLGRKFIRAGADVVIGGHTHCLQGMEYYNHIPVFYSLGNFWFDWSMPNARKTGMFQIVIPENMEKEAVKYRFVPCYYQNGKTRLLTRKKDKNKAYRYMEHLSWLTKVDSQGFVHEIEEGKKE
ncbi:poly-gamma-glutamate synthesis protein (capsule biosynthesis protein) [Lachnospiraceae bacterium XBB1006]|nr:poly-gamma-glutamate synthesis protein (capsule biosynthesis protein) [Lachnospiraceae bacterium XBB1006]